jgi:phage repressor protein C with HTH and peptisase S24 domain
MTINLKKLTEQLEISNRELNDLKKQIIESFDDENKMCALLNQQCRNQEDVHCLSCDDEGDCFILDGIIYLRINDIENTIKELEHANQHLRGKDEIWNSIIGLVLLGIAFEKCKKNHLALYEYKKAHEKLKNNYLRVHANDYMEEARSLANELQNKINELSVPSASTAPPPQIDSGNTNPNPPSNDDKDYLTLFSIPIYGTVEAGPYGKLHIDHFGDFTIVNKVELQGQSFEVHSVYGSVFIDRQITVTTTRDYGWLRVHGLSMNGWDMPFDENDYVLFYRSSVASHHDFVVASHRDASGEMALIVKRFDEKANQLLSKSNDTSDSYNPILLDEDHQIVGVVIAVAKPLQ